jgi:hypothetical protein
VVPPDTATGLWLVDETPEPEEDPDDEDDPAEEDPPDVEEDPVDDEEEPFEVEEPVPSSPLDVPSWLEPVPAFDVVPVEPRDPVVEPEVAGTTVADAACPGISWETTPTTARVAAPAAAVDHQKTRLTSDWAWERRWRCSATWWWRWRVVIVWCPGGEGPGVRVLGVDRGQGRR